MDFGAPFLSWTLIGKLWIESKKKYIRLHFHSILFQCDRNTRKNCWYYKVLLGVFWVMMLQPLKLCLTLNSSSDKGTVGCFHGIISTEFICRLWLNNTLYTCKKPLMMAYEGSESARDNFGKFIHQFQPKTKTLIRKLERILIKIYRQNMSLLFNETCSNFYICRCLKHPDLTLTKSQKYIPCFSFLLFNYFADILFDKYKWSKGLQVNSADGMQDKTNYKNKGT